MVSSYRESRRKLNNRRGHMNSALSMRFMLQVTATVLLAACAPAESPTPPDPEAVRASLIAADQAFAAATAAKGLEGWLAAFDTTAIQMEPDVPFTPGLAAIRGAMAPAFADTTWRLTWEPTMAFASAAGDLGYTLGTWQSTRYNDAGRGQVSTGKYVTIWRKQADGSWKVVFDGGNPDSSPQLTTAP
jgi:ketosteroid isomerase-like protein